MANLGRGALETHALDIAASVLEALSDQRATNPSVKPRDERRVSDAVRLICDSADEIESESLTISALGSAVGMSPYHFLRTFRRTVGATPHQYLIRQRVHRAAMRLLTSDDSVSEIAVNAGFADLSTFNRRFKNLFGVSPRQYRRNQGGG
ncbi:MAG: helix-turn-helix transcriptional regulator [Pseudomonadales bacterium]